jgi:hypothetical protein
LAALAVGQEIGLAGVGMSHRSAPSKFEQLGQAIPQAQPEGRYLNRALAPAAVADPYGLERRRRVRVTIALDALDRLLMARRISTGEHAAGRTYQRLLEIHLGGPALDGGGVRSAHSDDIVVKAILRAGLVLVELVRIRRHIGERSERLLRLVLAESNPNTGRGWTLEEIAASMGPTGKHRVFAISQRLVEALEDLATHWRRVTWE